MNKIIKLHNHDEARVLSGLHDEHLKHIEQEFKTKVLLRNDSLKISGADGNIKKAASLIEYILEMIRAGEPEPERAAITHLIRTFMKTGHNDRGDAVRPNYTVRVASGRQIGPKTKGQQEYVEAIRKYDIVFGIGPAGTGKTYLAMMCAVDALKKQEVRRIILTRPALEAGESLGFLPGDIREKISPYLRPLYDALYDMMEAERIEKYLETGIIEVAPLAFMRGRTLNDAFIILDEAQNCTAEQMKMFLTRLGFDSKAVITGDLTQSDLPGSKPLGLLQAQEVLSSIEGIKIIYLTGSDVVRHALVQRIIEAYDTTLRQK